MVFTKIQAYLYKINLIIYLSATKFTSPSFLTINVYFV